MELGEPSGLLYEDIYGEGGRARTRSRRPLSILLFFYISKKRYNSTFNTCGPTHQPSNQVQAIQPYHRAIHHSSHVDRPGKKEHTHARVCQKTVSTPKEPRERILMGMQQVFACCHAMKLKKYPECRKPYLCKLALV